MLHPLEAALDGDSSFDEELTFDDMEGDPEAPLTPPAAERTVVDMQPPLDVGEVGDESPLGADEGAGAGADAMPVGAGVARGAEADGAGKAPAGPSPAAASAA